MKSTANYGAEEDVAGASSRPLRVRTIEVLWHCNERNEEAELLGMQSGLTEGITSIDYNPRWDRIVTTGGDGNIRLWEMHTDAIDAWLANTASDMLACCRHLCRMRTAWMPLTARWSPQGEMIASAHCDGKICLWWRDPAGGSASGTNNGTASASGAGDGDGDVEEWKAYRHLTGHISDVYDLCFSADSRYLLSGAGDGSIVIHSLEASTMPVLQLTDLHSKFCRGVAWDPWTRFVHTFGCGPALLCFTHVPKGEHHRRMHLAGQRRCQGDFIGESCALSYRRLSWSPDGLLLAVPYGKFTTAASSSQQRSSSTSNLLASIEAKERAEAQKTDGAASARPHAPSKPADAPVVTVADELDEEAEDMRHCVYIYSRGAPDKVACRLGMRGFSEVRGVLWAPCFLEPPTETQLLSDDAAPLQMLLPQASDRKQTNAPEGAAAAVVGAATRTRSASPATSTDTASKGVTAAATAEAARQRRGAWGPAEYRMALAVWTSDAVIVYTTDSSTRHSDFTDLHMRSITDVAWSSDASHLYTASLDGYISVIAFGPSLAVAHRLPTFSASPLIRSLCAVKERIAKVGIEVEAGRSSGATGTLKSPPTGTASAASATSASTAAATLVNGSNSTSSHHKQSGEPSGAATAVAVVRKKKRVEKTSSAPAAPGQEDKKDVDMQQLAALMSDL